jgi:four helix bundle protein
MANHKDLEVWKESMLLSKWIYSITSKFPKQETFGLTSQMRRCSVSIPSNIAEGAARNSNKEFIQFLYISLGSLAELETQIILSKEFGFLLDASDEIKIISVRKKLLGLIKYLKKNTYP